MKKCANCTSIVEGFSYRCEPCREKHNERSREYMQRRSRLFRSQKVDGKQNLKCRIEVIEPGEEKETEISLSVPTITAIIQGSEDNSLISFPFMPKFNATRHLEAISKILSSPVACSMITEDLGHSVRKSYLGRKDGDCD